MVVNYKMVNPYPIGSMYGIYANIWGIFMVNVTIYSIHGSYGYADPKNKAWDALGLRASLHRLLEDFMASCCVVVSFTLMWYTQQKPSPSQHISNGCYVKTIPNGRFMALSFPNSWLLSNVLLDGVAAVWRAIREAGCPKCEA